MERGSTRFAEVLAVLLLLLFSAPFATPPARAQSGQWVITTSIQVSLSIGLAMVTMSGSGSAYLNVNDQGKITGTGGFRGSIAATASAGCSGGGTWQLSEDDVYSGQMMNWATGNSTVAVTSSGTTAPTTVTVTCSNPSPPPATVTYSVPIPSQMASSAGSFSIMLVDGYTYAQSFPAPMTGSYSMSIRGGTTTTTTIPSTTRTGGSLGVAVPYGEVQLCDSNGNNCTRVSGGETLQPGQCLVTLSRSGVVARSANMEVAIGENSRFCLPATREGISALCIQAQVYATIQGSLHVGTFGMGLGQNVYIRTPSTGVCDMGTEFAIRTSDTGTTVMVLGHAVVVTELASNGTVTMGKGQVITVQSSPSGMGQMAMQQAIESFDPVSVDRWWLSSGTQTTSSASSNAPPAEIPALVYLAVPGIVVLAIVALALSRARSRRTA